MPFKNDLFFNLQLYKKEIGLVKNNIL